MNFIANAEVKNKVWDLIKDIHVALMVTQDSEGKFCARPMGAQEKDENGQLWFFTGKNSSKVTDIEQNPQVLLSYSNPSSNDYVSLNGSAEIITDRAKINQLWTEMLRTWFPEGKDDPNIALIRFQPESAEYWDAPSNTFIHAYGYMKARLTGEQPNIGDNRKVNLQ